MRVEARQVIALRMAGMAGVWSIGPDESRRMVDEKVAALTESVKAAFAAGAAGTSAAAVAMPGIRPLRRRTKANARHLTKMAGGRA